MWFIFNAATWAGILLLAYFLITATYRIVTGRTLLPFFTLEQERRQGPKTICAISSLLGIGYLGLSYLKGSFL